ncbi:hypothetical protein C8F01DRAFT_967833, partial [Mycena amicta]
HIPRPPGPFMLFRASLVSAVPATTERSPNALSAIAGFAWQRLSLEQKAIWYAAAKEKRAEHTRQFPGYVFRP